MDFYILLGIDRAATLNDIKRAYKRLARKYHPDINPGDHAAAQQFRQIAEAYETLSDPDRRRRYDTVGFVGEAAGPTAFGFEGFDFSVSVAGSSAPTFGDLFADIFRERDSRTHTDAPIRGADLHASLAFGFEEAMRGGERQIMLTRQVHCSACGGAGYVPTTESRCPHCQGSGALKSARGHMVFSKVCQHCGGTGRQGQIRCSACGGHQFEIRIEPLTINVPPGL